MHVVTIRAIMIAVVILRVVPPTRDINTMAEYINVETTMLPISDDRLSSTRVL
jgi:hypothetical protein